MLLAFPPRAAAPAWAPTHEASLKDLSSSVPTSVTRPTFLMSADDPPQAVTTSESTNRALSPRVWLRIVPPRCAGRRPAVSARSGARQVVSDQQGLHRSRADHGAARQAARWLKDSRAVRPVRTEF